MSLFGGDLTTPQRVTTWMAGPPSLPSNIINQLITSMTGLIYGKLNRIRLYSQSVTRVFDGVGNMQIELPDWPVTAITSVQQGNSIIPPAALIPPNNVQPQGNSPGYGYRFVPWNGNLPGEPSVIEFVGGFFYTAAQNVRITYQTGYLVSNEPGEVPGSPGPYTISVLQAQGVWCRDNGVTYTDGTPLTPVKTLTMVGQYIPPTDAAPGVYTFYSGDAHNSVLISYSFVPSPLEEACIQMIAERYGYRSRVGEISKSLGGQETMRFMRGSSGSPWDRSGSLPPEVMDLIWPYVSVIPPAVGAPL